MKIIKSQTHYRNDAGTNATIVQQDNNYIVYTDLSAEEKKYSSLKEAQHDLIISGFTQLAKKTTNKIYPTPKENTMKTKILNVGVFCSAYYNSYIEVPADMSLEEAIEYAQKHIKELPIVNGLEYVEDSDELDKDNCDFE